VGTPIINQQQAGILGVGAIVKRAVVLEQNGIESIAIRPIGYLALTFDHRVCDGADADRFLREVKRVLEGNR
jgi:2-oxoglutarate dehydrogenase E2 component (dihydrolipoamide succinyltransferase)